MGGMVVGNLQRGNLLVSQTHSSFSFEVIQGHVFKGGQITEAVQTFLGLPGNRIDAATAHFDFAKIRVSDWQILMNPAYPMANGAVRIPQCGLFIWLINS